MLSYALIAGSCLFNLVIWQFSARYPPPSYGTWPGQSNTRITSVGHPWSIHGQSRWISDVATLRSLGLIFFLRLPPKALPGSTGGGGGGGGWGGGGWGGEEGLGEEGGGGGGWRQQRLHPSPRPPSLWRGESHALAQILKNPRNPKNPSCTFSSIPPPPCWWTPTPPASPTTGQYNHIKPWTKSRTKSKWYIWNTSSRSCNFT